MSAGTRRGVLRSALKLAATFWLSGESRRSWLMAAIIGLSIYGGTQLAIAMNTYSGTMTDAVVARDWAVLRPQLMLSLLAMVAGTVIGMVKTYVKQWIEIDWRRDLIDRLVAQWLKDGNFYRLERDRLLDNADQRIGEDVFLFIDHTLNLVLTMVTVPSMIVIYGGILWRLGGALDLAPVGVAWRVPGGLFWLASVAVLMAAGATLVAGRHLLPINVERQRREGDLRFSLAGIRNHAEEIAFYRGGAIEGARIGTRLSDLSDIWYRMMRVTVAVNLAGQVYALFGSGAEQLFGYGPYLAGRISYGTLVQISGSVVSLAMSMFTLVQYVQSGNFYVWASSVRRLQDLADVLAGKVDSAIRMEDVADAAVLLQATGLELSRPDGSVLTHVPDCCFMAGQSWLVKGPSGAGKSTLMRALAGLWPYGRGHLRRRQGVHCLFLPQNSYVPPGPLWDALCYPSPPRSASLEDCRAALVAARLPGLVDRLEEEASWQQRLSPGEQQRLAFARAFLQQPDVLLLDEATSALDQANETHLYTELMARLPQAAIISIAHRDSLFRFHTHQLAIAVPEVEDSSHDR